MAEVGASRQARSASEYDVLRPPAASLTRTPFRTRSSISRNAVSCEHLASFAHLDDVRLPSKPLSSWLMILRCRSLKVEPAQRSQKRAFVRTAASVVSASSNAPPRQSRNHPSQS